MEPLQEHWIVAIVILERTSWRSDIGSDMVFLERRGLLPFTKWFFSARY